MVAANHSSPLIFPKNEYTLENIQEIFSFLKSRGTFNFPSLTNGLFSAAILQEQTNYTGYNHVWVRDNIYVAYAHYVWGQPNIAVKNLTTIASFFQKHQYRFQNIISNQADRNDVMQRPHIRFIGETLEESEQNWQHAQNDALGYFLWLYSKLALENLIQPQSEDWKLLSLFPEYFQAVEYWQDEDSGHWEEDRKIEASSIGVAVAGLEMLLELIEQKPNPLLDRELIKELITKGKQALDTILPFESVQPQPKKRLYDAALLFLIYPLQVVDEKMAKKILSNIAQNLQGDYGIRRYLGDSFWCRNYKDLPSEIRTTISAEREAWLADRGEPLVAGEEAQWCIFDPIVSIIYGQFYHQDQEQQYLEKQIYYFNRSLAQITKESDIPSYRCPELYYLQDGNYIANDSTPLLWTQANLWMAFHSMKQSLKL